jgi:hypothetical protein
MFAAVEFPEASLFLSGALIHETGYLPTILHSLTVLARARLAFNFGTDRLRSILKPTTEEIVAQLIQQGLAPDTARRCADLFDEVEWHNAQLPLRQWLESIRDFYHKKPVAKAASLAPMRI